MDPERWKQVQSIFLDAAELPPEEAATLLDRQCAGDADLRSEVEELLRVDRGEGNQIDEAVKHMAVEFAADNIRTESARYIGRRIGPYQIVREIGRGGMGAVYQAVRVDDQYLRSVAIKFIAHDIDTPDTLARFRMERQILATLQHPNIAALLDGGATDDGRPYLVMEYIEGEPLLEYCRTRKLGVTERLELFCDICSAVHHAHQMLVIHRDIKPGNVLVTNDGTPKLLDFGIAKLMTPELVAGLNTTTQTVARRFTPQYASPEQVRGEVLSTASDVYSLGVLLYELLTEESPYQITGRSSMDIERAICDSEPARPSMAVRKDMRLRRQLSGDLDNIVGMALRKEPQRRYSSAQQLAEDIRRYLKGLPVSARHDTILYVARKLVWRNKLASAALALLVVSVAAGWAATIREARRTEKRFQEVRKLANSVLFDFHAKIQHLPGATPARELLVGTALDYLNGLSKDARGDPSLEWEISQAYEQVGDVQGDPSGPNLGRFTEALASYRTALSMVETISARRRDQEVLSCMTWLYFKVGDLELRASGAARAIENYNRGLQVVASMPGGSGSRIDEFLRNGHSRLAAALLRTGEQKAALENARLAAAAADRVAGANPSVGATANRARTRLLLGNVLWLQGDLSGARSDYERAVEWLEGLVVNRPDDVATNQELQEAYMRTGDLLGNASYFHFGEQKLAEFYHGKSVAIAERLAARDPMNAPAQAQLATALRRLGAVLGEQDPATAADLHTRAIAIVEQLLAGSPQDASYRRDLANTRLGRSRAYRGAGNWAAALADLQAGIATQRELILKQSGRSVVREEMVGSLLALADVQLAMGSLDGALASLKEAQWTVQALLEENAQSLYTQRCQALVWEHMGDYQARAAARSKGAQQRAGLAEAAASYEKALGVWSSWRNSNLALPYSAQREKELRALLAGVR